MKDFTDELVNLVIQNETSRINDIMKEVTKKISIDFTKEVFKLVDAYYEDYVPIRYVRVYGGKRKLKTKSGSTKMKSRGGQVSLHAAITRGGEENALIGFSGGDYYNGYVGGVVFDEGKFKGNGMRHIGKGKDFSEWNIVENFLFAGDGVSADMEPLKGDIRSYIDYNSPSADSAMMEFMSMYDTQFNKHYENAKKKFG